jgi:hypothetical protein
MNPSNLLSKEFIEFIKNKKTMVIKLSLPLILSIPLMIPGIPLYAKAGLFAMIIIFISTFGSSVSLIQLKDNKLIERLALLPTSEHVFIYEYIASNSIIDTLKMSIPLLLFLIFNITAFNALNISWIILNFIISIIFANALGVIVALIAKSSGEGHLFSIIMVLVVSLISGIFFTSLPPLLNFLQFLTPFYSLSNSIINYWNGILQISIIPLIPILLMLILIYFISLRLFRLE